MSMSPQPDNQADAQADRRDPARKGNDNVACQRCDTDPDGYVKYRQKRNYWPWLLGV
jgi:hypothetical protein